MRVKQIEVEINMDVDSFSDTVIQQLSEAGLLVRLQEDQFCCIRKFTLSRWYFLTIVFAHHCI